ncbi:MAG: hypothetical protein COV71_01790, partial [Candidatus Omnitrophica bacterium CG11_big_fil_rev_8_21_14_0_20_41_12]
QESAPVGQSKATPAQQSASSRIVGANVVGSSTTTDTTAINAALPVLLLNNMPTGVTPGSRLDALGLIGGTVTAHGPPAWLTQIFHFSTEVVVIGAIVVGVVIAIAVIIGA